MVILKCEMQKFFMNIWQLSLQLPAEKKKE